MLDLASQSNSKPVTLKDISVRQNISEKYLWQVIAPLKTAGIIHSTPGSRGGYSLAQPSESITLKNILDSLEGRRPLVPCLVPAKKCERNSYCAARDIWHEVDLKLNAVLNSITLKDMVAKQELKNRAQTVNYAI